MKPANILASTETASARQTRLRQFLQARKDQAETAETPAIPRAPRTGKLPLSFAQERLWFLEQMAPNRSAYLIRKMLRLKGPLGQRAIERSLDEVLRRHEALRTAFALDEGSPIQIIGPAAPFTLPLVDLTGMAPEERNSELHRRLAAEARRPFDLSRDLMLRGLLVRLGAREHVLCLALHHIAADAWSMDVLMRELTAFYAQFSQGQPANLPEAPIQYADYAIWQRQWLQGPVLREQLDFWKAELAGAPDLLELPADHPRPAARSFAGAEILATLPPALTEALRRLSRQEKVTLFMLLQAAFATLLYRYTRQTDIVMGIPSAGRSAWETHGMIGFFVNTLVSRCDLAGAPAFRRVIQQVRQKDLEILTHQDLPFEKLVQALHPERSSSHQPVFQVMFAFEEDQAGEPVFPGLEVSTLSEHNGTAKFDLLLTMTDTEGASLSAAFEYATDLFEAPTIERMLGHWQTLLEGIAANPDEKISHLPLLTPAERQQLLVEWNATEAAFPPGESLHQLVESQAARTPGAVAVEFEGERLTYGELNRRANQLARYLRQRGVGPETVAGLCVERSIEMVVGLLGVLKAGGAYVPLDPRYPRERLTFMLADAQAQVLLTQATLAPQFANFTARIIHLDADWPAIAREETENLPNLTREEQPAYVIYTSGSTGQPKGVVIPYRAIVNHMRWMQATFPLSAADGVLQKTPFSFDASVWEFFAPLMAGARLVVARPDGHRDMSYLIETIIQRRVTILQLVPSMMRLWLETPGVGGCQSLRRVFCGGEALAPDLVKLFYQQLSCELHNLYGPTEAAIDATYWSADRERLPLVVPIGRPIANLRAYVLSPELEPVPIGVPGELHLGGRGLARGYWNRPELTAEKFIPNPFSRDQEERLYKTGDLVRYQPGGDLEYLGRLDHQVKLRGFRIETGEIESALDGHPAVRESALLVREDTPGDKRLVAYFVGREEGPPPSAAELSGFLKTKLPDYMVPSDFVLLDSLPRTPNGKLDRQALPAPQRTRAGMEDVYAAPQTLAQEVLSGIWREVLGMEQIGIYDNFFKLGGHSLAIIKILSRLRRSLGVDVPIQTFFEQPTIAGLAEVLEDLLLEQIESSEEAETETAAERAGG